MRYSGTECPFERGVDPGGQAADAVADPGGLAGKVVVESDEPPEFGEGLVADVDPAQRVRRGAAVSAMMSASRASVFAWPGYRSATRRIDSPGR